jgi:hypothetical protein
MPDPLRTDTSRAPEPASEAERDAKIEQLLLTGLDFYFAAEYEDAINVWTRALFFDRGHARARAYIERARSALAERQRESEELLQTGVAAFNRGEGSQARRLLEAALQRGAPPDEALAVLERLNRLEHGQGTQPGGSPSLDSTRAIDGDRTRRPSKLPGIVLASLILVIVAAGVYAAGAGRSDWRSLLELPKGPLAAQAVPIPGDTALPLPQRGEIALGRAREFALSGRLHDALAALDFVRPTDKQKAEADRLRAEIQKQLIGVAGVPVHSSSGQNGAPRQP